MIKPPSTRFKPRGHFDVVECDPDGRVVAIDRVKNAATLAGITAMFDDFFNAGTQKTQWFFGLIDNSGYSTVDEEDTPASHPGWDEAVSYSGNRPQWGDLVSAGGIITNASPGIIVATADMLLKGLFIVSNSTKGGTLGTMWCTGLYGSVRTLNAGNSLRLTYTCVGTGGNA